MKQVLFHVNDLSVHFNLPDAARLPAQLLVEGIRILAVIQQFAAIDHGDGSTVACRDR
jgi:hypothetical protein